MKDVSRPLFSPFETTVSTLPCEVDPLIGIAVVKMKFAFKASDLDGEETRGIISTGLLKWARRP